MAETTAFQIAVAGYWVLQLLVPAAITLAGRAQNAGLRTLVAIGVSWISTVFYLVYVYNPAGIAAGQAQGIDSPQMLYDNNTVASAIVGGGIYPALTALLAMAWLRRKGCAQQSAPIDAGAAARPRRD